MPHPQRNQDLTTNAFLGFFFDNLFDETFFANAEFVTLKFVICQKNEFVGVLSPLPKVQDQWLTPHLLIEF